MGVLTGIVEKHPIPVFAMKDTEESYATNQFASEFETSNVSSIPRFNVCFKKKLAQTTVV